MIHTRITTALLVIEIALTAILCVGAVSHAIDLNTLGISRPGSVDVNFISEEQGLGGSRYKECTGNLLTLFNVNLSDQLTRMANDLARDLLRQFTKKLSTSITCGISSAAGKWTVTGIGNGGRFGGAKEECVKVSSSDMKGEMVQQLRKRLTSNFLVSCTAAAGRNAITETVTTMLQTQGPGGGPAWVTDYINWRAVAPEEMAQRKMWAILVNTDICPGFREKVLNDFKVPKSYRDSPPKINSLTMRANGGQAFDVRAQCTLPGGNGPDDSSVAAFEATGGIDGWLLANEEQNNYEGFMRMAQGEFARQLEAKIMENESMDANGVLPVTGECPPATDDAPVGDNCLGNGRIKVPAVLVGDMYTSDVNAQRDAWNRATGEQGAVNDIASQIQARLLDLANAPLPLVYESGPEQNAENYTPEPEPPLAPGETPTPDPTSPACTASNPQCTLCPDAGAQDVGPTTIKPAILQTIQTNPLYFINGTNEITPGVDYRILLQAVCDRISLSVCHPHPSEDDQIVFDFAGVLISYRIITSDGFIRTDGGSPVMQCTDGSM